MQFFRRYHLLVGLTFGGALLLSGWLLVQRVAGVVDEELERAATRLREQAFYLDRVLGSSAEYVDALEIAARRFLAFAPPDADARELALLSALQVDPGDRFTLPPTALDPKHNGHLHGIGSPRNAVPEQQRELRMALSLNPLFPIVRHNVQHAAWVYYLSASDFMNLFPWTPGKMPVFDRSVYETQGYRIATPAVNPARARAWSPAYLDFAGKGLMVTCTRPVYDGERFLGQVGLDLTLDFLNDTLRRFDRLGGEVFLVNDQGQLIAHPSVIEGGASEVLPASAALPDGTEDAHARLMELEPGEPLRIADRWALRQPLSSAPWHLVLLLPRDALWLAPLRGVGGVLLVLIAGVLLAIVVSQRTIRKRIVEPAGALVRHIEREGRGDAAETDAVPPEWRIWFAQITRTFEENRAHAGELEQRVADRTRDLNERNAQLETALRRLEDAQQELVLREKMASLGSLAAGVAHEINNPVGAIVAAADNVERCARRLEELIGPEQAAHKLLTHLRSNASALKEAGGRIAQTAAMLQPLDQLEQSQVGELDVNLVMRRALTAFAAERRADVELTTQLSDCPLLRGNAGDLGRAFSNLLRSAQDAIDGAGAIEVITRSSGDAVTVTVRDTGRGMSKREVAKIFDLRWSAQKARVSVGVGLAIAYAVVRKLGGSIDVESEEGAGTTVTISLPVGDAALLPKATAQQS